MDPLHLPSVTLVCATTRDYAASAHAVALTLERIRPRNTVIFTDDPEPFAAALEGPVLVIGDDRTEQDGGEAVSGGIACIVLDSPFASYEDVSVWALTWLPCSIAANERGLFGEHVLGVHWDGFVVNADAWDDAFLEFDHVGAPWPDGFVGNDGFCLRSRGFFEALAELRVAPSADACHPADAMLCRYSLAGGRRGRRADLERRGIRFAPPDLASRFAVEGGHYAGQFGFHGAVTLGSVVRAGLSLSGGKWRGEPTAARAVALSLQHAFERGVRAREQGRFGEAEVLLRQVVEADATVTDAQIELAKALLATERHDDAIDRLLRALTYEPGRRDAAIIVANAFNALGLFVDARYWYERACPAGGAYSAYAEWCRALHLLGSVDAAERTEGMRGYARAGQQRMPHRRTDVGEWRADHCLAPGQTLYVACEQGRGDAVFFARWLPDVVRAAGPAVSIVWECHADMAPLFAPLAGIHGPLRQIVALDPDMGFGCQWDEWISYGALPAAFAGAEGRGGAFAAPEIVATALRIAAQPHRTRPEPPERVGGPLRIGICWKGSPRHPHDRQRSLRAAEFAPIVAAASRLGMTVVTLQHGEQGPATGESPDISATDRLAAAILDCDAVISCDTFVANLAGALGVPGCVLVAVCPDWRWLRAGERSPWYPSLTICRQRAYREWRPAVDDASMWLQWFAAEGTLSESQEE